MLEIQAAPTSEEAGRGVGPGPRVCQQHMPARLRPRARGVPRGHRAPSQPAADQPPVLFPSFSILLDEEGHIKITGLWMAPVSPGTSPEPCRPRGHREQPSQASASPGHHVPGPPCPWATTSWARGHPPSPATTSRAQGCPPPPRPPRPGLEAARPPRGRQRPSRGLWSRLLLTSALLLPGATWRPRITSRPRALDSHACRVPFAMPGDLVAGPGVDPGLASPHTPHRVPRTSTGHFRGRPARLGTCRPFLCSELVSCRSKVLLVVRVFSAEWRPAHVTYKPHVGSSGRNGRGAPASDVFVIL